MASRRRTRKDDFDILTGNDADADRHGIVTPDGGLMNPNHYLAVAIQYLYTHRPDWRPDAAIGKTLVSSVDDRPGRRVARAPPVGGARSASSGSCPGWSTARVAFGGEESAGRELPAHRRHGLDDRQRRHPARPARQRDPRGHRQDAVAALRRARREVRRPGLRARRRRGHPRSRRPASASSTATPSRRPSSRATRSPRSSREAPGNGAAVGGVKVVTENAWFAARPSGTEDVYKIYAESFEGPEHLKPVQAEAKTIVDAALGA